ncbi:acetolactate synthase small subunit [Flavobacterium sp. LHD-80]|uniref:acetolactate synthase small subunit n=1 Tax=Flavobacterium sp. LHD-80 TaxID=3071411 RepID=UPI0027E0A8CD|nr:acetolactate synthase small subunit [Flavobacterium sp. LHD-80]MDQ6473042.1 acetolactate synthase small subunit [Flavobacterium sp. LHD-80]
MKQEYTLTAYTEDQMGLLNKITVILSRRKINLESINISACEIEKMYRCTLVINETFEIARNIALQIEKIIEVYSCYCNTNEDIVWKQMGLFKVRTSSFINDENRSQLLRKYDTRSIIIEKDFTVFEVSGQEDDINNLATELKKYGLIEFVKTARIAITRNSEAFDVY